MTYISVYTKVVMTEKLSEQCTDRNGRKENNYNLVITPNKSETYKMLKDKSFKKKEY